MSKKKKKFTVTVTMQDGTIEDHDFRSKDERRAFIRGLSTMRWRSYTFEDTIPA